MNYFSNFKNMESTSISNSTNDSNIHDKTPVNINKKTDSHHKTILNNSNDNANNNKYSNTNKLQSFLSQQEQVSSRINGNTHINNDNQSLTTISNFYTITQYILQSYYKVNFNDLLDLKVTDLIVDQTYPDSLTLRKLNDSATLQTYQYFNTISRDPDISKCPIFALSVYFVIRWSHPSNLITVNNYKEIKLLDPNHITFDPNPMFFIQNHLNGNVNSTTKILRSTLFEPSSRLINLVFPWLENFKKQILAVDRTNYILHSLCELFEFMGKIIIQDLRYLHQHALLLPNIVSFMDKFIPKLLSDEEFKGFEDTNSNTLISNGNSNSNNINHLINNENNSILLNSGNPINNSRILSTENSNNNVQLNSTNISRDSNNDMVTMQTLNNSTELLSQYVDTKFVELSKKLTTENIRLSQQVAQLKSDLGTLSSMCSQMIQLQRQIISGQNAVLTTNQRNKENENISKKNNNLRGINDGILIVDKSSLHDSSFRNIIESLRENINQNKDITHSEENNTANNVQPQDSINSSVLAPMKVIPNLDNSNIQTTAAQVIQTAPSPKPAGNHSSRQSSLSQAISQLSSGPREKRKLPLPQMYYESLGSVGSPFSINSPMSASGMESPFTKKMRLDDRPTPSQTALDSLLYKSISSPRERVQNKNPSSITEPSVTFETNKDLTLKYPTNFIIDNSSRAGSETSTVQPNNGDSLTIVETRNDVKSTHQESNKSLPQETPQEINMHRSVSTFERIPQTNFITVNFQGQNSDNNNSNIELNENRNAVRNTQKDIDNSIYKEVNFPENLEIIEKNNTSFKLSNITENTDRINNSQKNRIRIIKEFTVVGSNQVNSPTTSGISPVPPQKDDTLKPKHINGDQIQENIMHVPSQSSSQRLMDKTILEKEKFKEKETNKNDQNSNPKSKKKSSGSSKGGPNQNIKYKLSRENKTIWDLYAEWYIGINGKPSIKKLIEEYGWRRWKVTEDSHFFPTRKIIMQYIETECDRGISLGRFSKDQPRDEIRKIIVGDLEKFRINNGLTLNSLSLYFKNLTKKNKELCIFKDFNTWQTKKMSEIEKNKYSKRKHTKGSGLTRNDDKNGKNGTTSFVGTTTIPVLPFKSKIYNIQPIISSASHNASSTNNSTSAEKNPI